MPVKTAAEAEDSARCLTLFALLAAKNVKSPSSLGMTARFTAVIVSLIKDNHKMTPSGVFLFTLAQATHPPVPVKWRGVFAVRKVKATPF